MLFAKLKVQLRLLILTFIALGLAGCVATPPIVASRSACSSLLPSEWRKDVPGADLPGDGAADWVVFGNAQTGQLAKANEQKSAGFGIIERCEARDREAVAKSRKKFLGILR